MHTSNYMCQHKSGPISSELTQEQANQLSSQVASTIGFDTSGNKMFKCGHCTRRSNWKQAIIKHLRKDHRLSDNEVNAHLVILPQHEAARTLPQSKNPRSNIFLKCFFLFFFDISIYRGKATVLFQIDRSQRNQKVSVPFVCAPVQSHI